MKNALKILIVDDHKTYRKSLKNFLKINFKESLISEAENGQECLEMISKDAYDLILMDIQMPVMNGIEATKAAVSLYPDSKIICISMFGSTKDEAEMTKAGASAFLSKESDPTTIVKVLVQVLNTKKDSKPIQNDHV